MNCNKDLSSTLNDDFYKLYPRPCNGNKARVLVEGSDVVKMAYRDKDDLIHNLKKLSLYLKQSNDNLKTILNSLQERFDASEDLMTYGMPALVHSSIQDAVYNIEGVEENTRDYIVSLDKAIRKLETTKERDMTDLDWQIFHCIKDHKDFKLTFKLLKDHFMVPADVVKDSLDFMVKDGLLKNDNEEYEVVK